MTIDPNTSNTNNFKFPLTAARSAPSSNALLAARSPELEPTPTHEEDLDYSTAFRREVFRRQKSEQYFKLQNLDEVIKKPRISNGDFLHLPPLKFDDQTIHNNAIFDVLPSFEMYHSLQFNTKRESMDNSSLRDFPPDYSDPSPSTSNSTPDTISDDDLIRPTYQNGVLLQPPTERINPVGNTHQSTSSPGREDLSDKNIVDNYHTFPQLDVPGLDIKIHVTKNVPIPDTKNENESPLKEYTSGDIVHGYVIIENNTSRDIPFYGFYVTLQGTISVIDMKSKKQILKTFLSMVDLSASWSYACISSSAVNQQYQYGTCDIVDGAEFGLRNDRILAKGRKYKKFFTFKFPYTLLDTSCRHDQPLHLLLPPTLGFNKLYKRGKYSDVVVDPLLNYGLNASVKGSPIMTKDLSDELVSVSYSINAVLISNERSETKGLEVLKHQEFFLRFIPFGFNESLFSSKSLLKNFKKVIQMNLKQCENFFNGEYKPKVLIQENTASLTPMNSKMNGHFPLRNEDEIPTEVRKTLKFSSKPSFLSKKPVSHGIISISSKIPKDGLPYMAPSLIQKLNEKSMLTEKGYENLNNMLTTLSNTERKVLDNLSITLRYESSQSSLIGSSTNLRSVKSNDALKNLPKLESVDVELIALNIFSDSNVPIKLSADIFIDQNSTSQDDFLGTFKSQFSGYQKQYDEHKKKFDQLEMNIDRFFAPTVYKDLRSIIDMTSTSTVVKKLFTCKMKQSEWTKPKPTDGQSDFNGYEKKVTIKLDLMKNISETLIPNFQSCLLSRFYFLKVKLAFNGGVVTDLKIPIRLRKFDDF
ncbi:hypothetical protein WICPIJ_004316 [Wickerhamomyces pijperi]|uniref:Ubiquitin ligase-binding protein BUL2 n=1 Tax=Wickerhamomyces pijperi TaxID=599730 RepID=A0A9P8Q874_WICPI|nr:hypothetical protein WICPIJ_004316 [Wickerhamomyces pijperi]